MLYGVYRRNSEFGSGAGTLQQSQGKEHDRSKQPNLGIGREHADRSACGSHQDERPNQCRLAAEPVADHSKNDTAEWPCDITDREEGKCGETGCDAINGRKEQLSQDQR